MMSKFYNNVKTALLLGMLSALILMIGSIWGTTGVVIALMFAIIMNIVGYFFSAKIALASMQAQEVGPEHELYRLVEPMAKKAGMPMPKVYVAPTLAPNAFATGRNPKNAAVCATQGLLQMLDRNEVAGVMAHELAHVKHRDILIQSVAATIGAAISSLGYMFMFGGMNSSDDEDGGIHPLAGLLVLLVGPLAAGLIQAAISRSREFNADKEGGELCGSPLYLATALEKIHFGAQRVPMDVNPSFNSMFIAEPRNMMQSMASLFATHPPLEQRLMNLIGRESTGMFR
ncbi:MAG TPA: M48 family metalloprotease [Tepidisphaeraceae bacterium]|jgi:heat shock protein HtpX|nr:M48 family metalloprotease [Tepidisphaeraceae bacterium]